MMNSAFDKISDTLQDGEIVCIFPEGKLTADGERDVFKSGISKIVERNPVPIVPLALKGLWGSFFSRKYGNAMSRIFPRELFSKIKLVAVQAIPAGLHNLKELENTVLELRGENR